MQPMKCPVVSKLLEETFKDSTTSTPCTTTKDRNEIQEIKVKEKQQSFYAVHSFHVSCRSISYAVISREGVLIA